ncbi:SDR family oxidoreductase [Acidiferrimicrobium sp. IK]|uniref:SDR family NAD(P)-dependent oxidoreductase n=1 Tax=Acidiferrimicrobium sp. IK TaxID=2871700 RepID=UPI0021CB90A8|nr:SDR family NAD(P)-dependent oxidoreductase [Acidiferrimicrobium sp. IK]MCU4183881.1 SDR family oxidoreductase [Acidiferrimicrobium sp. IK]
MTAALLDELFGLTGQRAIVTGASRGIGARAAQTLDAAGARVALVARSESQLREIAATLANEPLVVPADLNRNEGPVEVAATVADAWGGADILVNNAGLSRPAPSHQLLMSDWDDILTLNLRSVFALTQAVAAGMLSRRHGRIINVSSVLGLLGEAWAAPYTASKAGVNGLSRTLAVEWASEGVTVNALCPGWIDTEMVAVLRANPQFDKRVLRRVAMHRWGVESDLDGALLLLAGPASSYLTGQTIVVDGGLAAGW